MQLMTFRELTDQLVVLYDQRKFDDAFQLVEQQRDFFPEQATRTTFWRMCLLSLTGRSAEVLSVFQQGLDAGQWWSQELFADPDLDAVRDLPEFKRLTALAEEKYQEERTRIPRDQAILLPEPPVSGKYPLLIALHGRNGNKESHLEFWDVARRGGWLVVSPQSTQPLFPGAYCWDNPARGMADVLDSYEQVLQGYEIDPQRLLIAGFSQGSGMALYIALRGRLPARGFIGIASWWADPQSLIPQTEEAKRLRAYFITGEKDHTFDTAKQIQNALKENNIQFDEESHTDLAHEFPPDFEKSFDTAIDFIFKEQE
jgi:predicted esterase